MFSSNNNLYSYNDNMFRTNYKITSIDDIILWLEPSKKNITLSNNKISSWKDISGNMNNTIQTDNSYMPKYQQNSLNGYPSILFDNDKFLKVNLNIDYFTIFTVFRSIDNNYLYEYGEDTTSETGFFLNGDNNPTIGVSKNGTTSTQKTYLDNWGIGDWRIVTHYYNGTHATHRIKINGSNVILNDYFSYNKNPGILSENKTLYIGSKANGIYGMNGNIAEYIIYNRLLNDNEMNNVTNYLNNKYSIY